MELLGSKRRWLAAIAVVSIFVLTSVLSGCGSKKDEKAGSKAPAAEKASFSGKNMTIIVPFSPGGGYDAYARLIQPYLEKATGATVIVQNVPGGGSIVGTNKLYDSKPDGLTIGIMGGANLVFAQTTGAEGVKFDVGKFTYIGRISADPSVLITTAKKPYKTVADLAKAEELKMAVTGIGEDDFYTWSVVAKAFGIKNYKMVTGWEGSSQWVAAVAAGQVDGGHISASSALPPIQNKYATALVQVSPQRDPRFPDVPTALEALPANDPNRKLVETLTNILSADRLMAAPPGMDEATAKLLREAFDKVIKDPDFLKKAEQAKRPVVYMSGQDVQKAVGDAMKSVQSLKPIFDEAAARVK